MKSKKAFTLIELLVVIAIIGLLATIAVIALNNARAKARDARRIADVKQIQTALELFFNDEGRYPTAAEFNSGSIYSTSTNGTTTYMGIIPTAPNPPDGNCNSDNNRYAYTPINNSSDYGLDFCLGGQVAHLNAGRDCATPNAGFINGNCCATLWQPTIDGEVYPSIGIGSQCWTAKNLNIGTMVTSGTSLPCVQLDFNTWSCQTDNNTVEKYCYNNHAINPNPNFSGICDSNNETACGGCDTDGGLYEWAEALGLPYDCNNAASTDNGDGTYTLACPASGSKTILAKQQGLCPAGWHIPSESEWTALESFLGATAGKKMKVSASNVPAWDGTNSSGFTALPIGYRDPTPYFELRNSYATFWSTLPRTGYPLYARMHEFSTGYDSDFLSYMGRPAGFPVRCIKD